MRYALIILPIASPKLYTYSVPEDLENSIRPGQRVVVEVRKKLYTGIVAELTGEKPDYDVKPVREILDPQPLISATYLKLWRWTADYYMCTPGEVFNAAVPPSLRLEGEQTVFPQVTDINGILLSEAEKQIFKLVSKKPYTINQIEKKLGLPGALRYVKNLVEKGIVRIDQVVDNPFAPKTAKFIRLNPEYNSQEKIDKLFERLKRAKKQTDLLLTYITLAKPDFKSQPSDIPREKLLEKVNSPSGLKALIDSGIFEQIDKPVLRFAANFDELRRINPLTPPQQQAFDSINRQFGEKDVVLLYGVTSSGKTEIYIHLIRQFIEQGKQVLYLLPEIAITTQIIYRLQAVFGDKVGIYHSKLSDNERAEVWQRVADNYQDFEPYQIVIGVRSAVFLPFKNLGLIIVDEEHENTYKQFDPAPRYNARDLAIVLARMTGAKVLLGTATPSIESFYNAQTGKYGYTELKVRYENIRLPQIILADTRQAAQKRKMHGIFHETLLQHIDKTLKQGHQVILFRNRRGFAPYLECQDCGWIPKCKHCDVSLTYHKETNKLVCHYCGYTIEAPRRCEKCGSFKIRLKSFGTERVEDELQVFFPNAKIERLDLDTTRAKNAHTRIIESFQNGEIDILVGTQMVTKGLDFENVRLVGVLNADSLINYPDFRSYERAFQLMVQVSGRAGRKGEQGMVIIQTAHPEHPVFRYVIENNYEDFYQWQLQERRDFAYPPFTRLIKITVKDQDQALVETFTDLLAAKLRGFLHHRVLGPEYPVVKRVQNRFRKEILIKLEPQVSLSKVKKLIIDTTDNLRQRDKFYKLHVIFDVDPM